MSRNIWRYYEYSNVLATFLAKFSLFAIITIGNFLQKPKNLRNFPAEQPKLRLPNLSSFRFLITLMYFDLLRKLERIKIVSIERVFGLCKYTHIC
jgi:hypothetical protein